MQTNSLFICTVIMCGSSEYFGRILCMLMLALHWDGLYKQTFVLIDADILANR